MYGNVNGSLLVTFQPKASLALYFITENNLWILQATYIPIILISFCLHIFIMGFMWRNGKSKQPIDKICFVDLSVSFFQMITLAFNKRFFLTLSLQDPGILFCMIERIAMYSGAYVHRLAATANAIIRSTFVCEANKMLDAVAKRKFIKKVFIKSLVILVLPLLMLLVALFIPGQEKSSQSWSNCRRTPEITSFNFQDFYLPHQKSKYDVLVFTLTILPMLLIYFISVILELYHVFKAHKGMSKYLDETVVIPESSRFKRRQKNVFTFKCTILLAATDILILFTYILGK